jgi:hypothetical protein
LRSKVVGVIAEIFSAEFIHLLHKVSMPVSSSFELLTP